MSFWRHKIKFEVTGISNLKAGTCKRLDNYYYKYGKKNGSLIKFAAVYVIGILAISSFVVFDPITTTDDYGLASVLATPMAEKSALLDEYNYTDGVNFKLEQGEIGYSFPGGKSVEVLKFKFYSKDDSIQIRNIILKVSGVSSGYISNAELRDKDGNVYSGYINGESILFRNVFLGVETGQEVYLPMYLDFASELRIGQRVHFSIEKPGDIDIGMRGEKIFVKKDYPVVGPSTSIVGKKIKFQE